MPKTTVNIIIGNIAQLKGVPRVISKVPLKLKTVCKMILYIMLEVIYSANAHMQPRRKEYIT